MLKAQVAAPVDGPGTTPRHNKSRLVRASLVKLLRAPCAMSHEFESAPERAASQTARARHGRLPRPSRKSSPVTSTVSRRSQRVLGARAARATCPASAPRAALALSSRGVVLVGPPDPRLIGTAQGRVNGWPGARGLVVVRGERASRPCSAQNNAHAPAARTSPAKQPRDGLAGATFSLECERGRRARITRPGPHVRVR